MNELLKDVKFELEKLSTYDGGGSTSFYYKKSNSELVKVSTGYDAAT